MKIKFLAVIVLTFLNTFLCDERFYREELGYADRLRFTSGLYRLYNCTVVSNRLVSNLKIGIYTHETHENKVSIHYTVNDTSIYTLTTAKVEDFYFAIVNVNGAVLENNKVIELTAIDSNTGNIIDRTLLYVYVKEDHNLPPIFDSNSKTISLYDDLFLGSIIGKITLKKAYSDAILYIDETNVDLIKEFSVSVDGRIILTKSLNAAVKNYFEFYVNARFLDSSLYSSIKVSIHVKPGLKPQKPVDRTFRNIIPLQSSSAGNSYTSHLLRRDYVFSISELAPKSTVVGSLDINIPDVNFLIADGDPAGIFQIDFKTGVLFIQDSQHLDYEKVVSYKFSITGFIKNEIRVLEAQVLINVTDENDHEPEFTENRYAVSIEEYTSAFTSILKVTALDKDDGNNGKVSYVISNNIKIPFVVDDDGILMLSEPALFPQMRSKYYVYITALDWGKPFRNEKEVTVEVNIQPVNSHAPVLKQQACNFVLSDASSSLFTFTAIDQDFNDKVQYKMESIHAGFTINSTSGVLSYVPQPGHTETVIYISAYDGKHESKVSVLNVKFSKEEGEKVCVDNEDFFLIKELVSKINIPFPSYEKLSPTKSVYLPLEFKETPGPTVNVLEDVPVNFKIGLYSTNIDYCFMVLYSIESGNKDFNFRIDPFNGTLYVLRPLDRELADSHRLTIKASNFNGEFIMSSLTVNVLDVNDNVPTFTNNGTYTVYVHEDWQIGRKIVTVEAIDLDLKTDIEYSLVNPSRMFKIDSKTGEVSLLSSLSDEIYIEYFIQVQASERSLMQDNQGFALIHIIVSELINNPPVCLTDNQHISVPIDSPVGVIVGRMFGYDSDQGENGVLVYTISGTKQQNQFGDYIDSDIFSNYFSMDKKSGLIQLIKTLPSTFEKFEVNALLEDGGKPSLKVACKMYATISEGFGNIKPVFTHTEIPLIVIVPENTPLASIVTEVYAKIPGRHIGEGIKYVIIDGNGILDFIMKNEHSGKITNKNSHFSRKSYWLTVQAQLESNPSVFTNTHILIRIKSVKVERPYIYPSVQFITVAENLPVGSKIIQLHTLSSSVYLYNESNFYSFQSGNEGKFFSIDDNGNLFVQRKLVVGQYDLNITVTSASKSFLFSYGNVHVIVEHDDLPPDFNMDFMANIQVFETKGSLHPPYLFQVLAENKHPEDLLVFKNLGVNSIFSVNPSTGAVTSNNTLVIGQEDYLTIAAKNSKGQSINENFIGITIIERPKAGTFLAFKNKSYYVSIDENKKGELIDFDKEIDKTTTGPVFFYILSGNEKQKFSFPLRFISKLYVINPLDYEQQQQHKLRILAFDGKAFAETELNIFVINLNDNTPSASQACYEASVKEGFRHLKERILSVKVIDPDNLNPDFKYQTINNFDDSFPFSVGENDGSIMVQPVELDRELKSEYLMTVVASNAVEQTAFCVQISLEDTNDNKPLFTSDVYDITIVDTTPIHSTVMVVYAVDKDIGSNAKVSYSFVENNDYFDVDPKYGFIYVKLKLNELSGQIVNLKLAGKDNGVPELIGYAYVKISVVADPNNIWFKVNNLTGSVSENIAPGTMLIDKIRVESTNINYEIAEKDDDCYTLFWVEPFTGSVFIKSNLDSEKTTQCVFMLNGVLNQYVVTTIKVLVNILDRNDNIPLVKDKSYIGSVSEGLSSNSNILDKDGNSLIVSATDEDQGINGMLRYSIIGNIGKIYFTIDEISGEIRTNKVLDYELHPRHFSFFIKVSDQGLPQHSVIVPVSIYLQDINDKIPSFKKHYTFTVNLPVFRGTVIGRVEAFDEDTVPNVPLQYSLLYTSSVLDINQFTGVISVKDESSLTSPAIMMLEVDVSDGTFKGRTNVKIETKYYKSDETFKFLDEIYNANVLENVDSFTIVKVINPVGYKRSEKLHFRLLNTVPGFDIIENVGAIVTDYNSKFDYENVKFYVLHIEAVFNNVYARTSLNVTVVDVNDHAPLFEQKKYFHPIDIETKKGTVLLKVTAHDADSGENGKVRYSMLTKDNYFSCDSITGEIVLANKFIKSLTKPIYTLIIEASDNGTNVLTSKTFLEIPVLNEDQPKFTKNYEATIDEDIGKGSSLFTVVAYGPQNRQVFYQLYDGDEFEVFEIGLTTGELKVAGNLDYEQRSSYKLQVKAIDSLSGSWALTDCEITLNDVNDNPPMFKKPFYKIFLKEDVKPGTVAGTVKATDLDKDLNSLISYSIESADEGSFFIVDPRTGDITTTRELDADVKSEYFLQITASDHGKPSKLTFVTVQIILIDINDNKPIFFVPKYYFFVEKFVQPKQFIGKVAASDLDSNTKLSYVLSKTSSFVKIDLFTGVLYLTGSPLPMTSILLEVMASDGVHVAFAEVIIDCLARNDYRPLVLEQIDVVVTENTMKNVLLADINPIDRDKGIYANVSYQIDSQTAAKYFSVNEFGKIYSTGYPLDGELIQQIVIPVRVTDDGGLFSIIQVVVTVEDQNDNTPIFEFPSYRATVVNSQITDDSLLQVFASDPDRGSNSELFYVAQGLREGNVPIFIDGRSGLISLSGTPKGSMYQFSVRVTDNGYPVQKSDTKVFICVKSWTEEVLRFNLNVYYVTISEDAPINSHLITVNAFLQGYNDTLTYSLVDGNLPHTNASQFFKIHPTTGRLKIRSPLNYEVLQRHKLLILVTSKKGDTSTCYVEINVTNVNDNAPKFNSSAYSFKIAEDTEIGERLLRVSAYDLDESYTESSLVYSIVSENKALFQVDKTTGWLSLKKQLDREVKASHEVLVVATDVDGKFDSTTVQISLVDVNDSPPVFLNKVYSITVKEDAIVGQTILKINAVDPDLNQKIEYFLISSSDNFAIDSQSGNIYLLRQLTQVFYNFTTVAYDGIHIGKADIWVNVQDFNNHNPICLSTFYEANVEENSDVNKVILQIKAEDEDPSDILKYQIHGDAHGKFVVDEKTGILKASSYLDFEIETRYRFKVVVMDLVGHTCTSDIFIKVIDINDNSPTFLQPLYKATLRENATYGVVVTQVKAFDKDSLKNGQISYSLLNNIRDTFTVHSQGIITVNKPLEIQPSTRYSLTVIGTDHGTPSSTSNTSVEIIVISNSDSPPQFDKFAYLFNVAENNELGIVIGKIKVTGTTSFDIYAIVIEFIDPMYESLFSIEDNGNLKVLKVLDYEEQTRYVFSLKASYKNIPLSSMVLVEVLVDDTNDNSPQFNQAVYSTQIDENIRSGTYVTQVFAQDNDGSKENSKITYRILQDTLVPFSIDFQGVIAVDGSIDREKKNEYEFDVIAVDSGIVQRSSKAKVKISIADLNDNAPIISEYNTSLILQEGKLPGTEILKLSISDLDTSKNGPPFVCSLFGGDSSIFEILTEGNNCVLRSKVFFLAKEHPQHQLIIRVSDSGFPKQYSDSKVKIIVVKESYNSPIIQEPKVFFVIVSKPYGVTLIGKVSVFDKDENDIHQYRLTGGTMLDYFSIQPMTGVIEGKPKKGVYTLSVEVTDGRNTDASLLQIIVNERDHDVETKSIVITIHGMDVQEFISKMTHFIKILAKITGNSMDSIFLWSIKEGTNSTSSLRKRKSIENKVSVAVAVKMEDNLGYMDIQLLKKYVEENTAEFKKNDLDISVSSIECNILKVCGENMKCLVKLTPVEYLSPFIPSGYMGFQRTENCYCSDGTEASVCHSVNPCSRNPCKSGEKCVVTRNSYYCDCVNPEKCGQGGESITLNGNSYIEYKLSKSFDELFHTLSLHFRTEYKDGYLVYAHAPAKDYFIVEIQGGHIQVRFDFGSGYVQKKIEEVKINDGDWHFVSIQRNGNRVIMSLDFNKYTVDVKAQGNSANINIDGRPIIFGSGLADNGNATFSGFTGCIKEPKLNKKLLPFMGHTEIVSRVDLHNTKSGCKDSGLCSVKHCPKFSDCSNTFTSYRCACLTGHYGLSCISNLTCEDRPCKNDGICTYERVADVVSYVCTCKSGFAGGQCHIALGECASNPCKNNGVCLPSSTDLGYTCSCVKGFSGKLCEINENPCLSSPCFNGGVCQNIDYDFKCTCPSGKSGRQCSAGQHCLVSRCENGGSCLEKNDNAVCQCREGFVGDRCQEDVNECLKDVCHSNGVCINIPGSFYCNCTDGLWCSLKSIYPEKKQFSLMLVFFGVCGTLLLIIIVVGVIYCKRRYHSRNPTHQETEMTKYTFDKYEAENLYPPSPPPRGVSVPPGYYDENDQASAGMYDPSLVTFSGTSSLDEKIPFKNDSSRTSVEYNSEEELHGYHWDYSGVPEDVIKSKMSREGSRLGTSISYRGEFVDLPKLPVRPASRRSSLPGYSESENDIPKLPELPQQIRLSRLSLKSSNQSPSYLRRPPDRAPPIEENRYSMRSDDTDNESYLQELLENETNSSDITNVTRPYTKPVSLFERAKSEISDISEDFDGYTVTSLNSNDEDDEAGEQDPLDPENTRKLERDIKRLLKDIQKRTEDN